MRALHLIDPGSPGGGACSLALLAETVHRLRSVEQDVVILGTRRHVDLARRCGVQTRGSMSAPFHVPTLGRRALQRVINAREAARGEYDLIHAWTPRTAVLATLAAPDRPRLGTFSVGPVTGFETRIFLTVMDRRPMPMLVAATGVLREYRSMGIDRRLLSLLPPGVNPERLNVVPAQAEFRGEALSREALRERWLGETVHSPPADRPPFIIGVLSEPANWADAHLAAAVAARLEATGRNVRILLSPGAARRPGAERWLRSLDRDGLVIVDDDIAEPWRIVHGLDAAILIGGELNSMDLHGAGSPWAILLGGGRRLRPMPGIQPLLWAMGAGVPVIAEASDAVRDVIDEGVSGLLVPPGDVNAVCDRLMRMYDDRTIAGRIGAGASKRIAERFTISAWCVRLREAYELLIAGRPVRVARESDAVIEPLQMERAAPQTIEMR